ncbi:MAG: hypothetical protein AB8G18_19430 [Gammaproteobacteria bacterium]
MSQRAIVAWAVSASVIAVGAVGTLGYLYGKNSVSDGAHSTQTRHASEQLYASDGVAREATVAFKVPESMMGMEQEWRSVTVDTIEGYAILFAPESRQLIVEHCRYDRYQLDDNGRPVESYDDFCSEALRGTWETLSETEGVVRSANGSTTELTLDAKLGQESPSLEIRFTDHHLALSPGSKNDLVQAFEQLPAVKERKRKFLLAQNDIDSTSGKERFRSE